MLSTLPKGVLIGKIHDMDNNPIVPSAVTAKIGMCRA
jgi:hypothetical protein